MRTDVCMLFFHTPDFGLADAAHMLAATRLSLVWEDDHLLVRWGQGPELAIHFVLGAWVQQEAIAIGKASPYAALLQVCDRRFEISCSDLEAVIDEANTLIEAQLTLQAATQGILFNSWNGVLLVPDTE